jgi:hypothetical protein
MKLEYCFFPVSGSLAIFSATYPPSLSQNDTLNLGDKSQLLNILENDINMPSSEPVADTLIIDGTALVNSKPPNVSATFDDYANDVIVPYIQSYAQRHSRIDVVFDVCLT